MSKVYDYGLPFDYYMTRANQKFNELAPSLCSWLMERRLQKRFDHVLYGLQPAHKFHQSAFPGFRIAEKSALGRGVR